MPSDATRVQPIHEEWYQSAVGQGILLGMKEAWAGPDLGGGTYSPCKRQSCGETFLAGVGSRWLYFLRIPEYILRPTPGAWREMYTAVGKSAPPYSFTSTNSLTCETPIQRKKHRKIILQKP